MVAVASQTDADNSNSHQGEYNRIAIDHSYAKRLLICSCISPIHQTEYTSPKKATSSRDVSPSKSTSSANTSPVKSTSSGHVDTDSEEYNTCLPGSSGSQCETKTESDNEPARYTVHQKKFINV